MSGFGANFYKKTSVDGEVLCADPHKLVQLLFDGALVSMQRTKVCIAEGDIPGKCRYIGHAMRIVQQGLRASVDRKHDPAFADRLIELYDYVSYRLLRANVHNDGKALDDAIGILSGLRDAWAKIRPEVTGGLVSSAGAPADALPGGASGTGSANPSSRLVSPALRAYQFA